MPGNEREPIFQNCRHRNYCMFDIQCMYFLVITYSICSPSCVSHQCLKYFPFFTYALSELQGNLNLRSCGKTGRFFFFKEWRVVFYILCFLFVSNCVINTQSKHIKKQPIPWFYHNAKLTIITIIILIIIHLKHLTHSILLFFFVLFCLF